MSKPIFREPFEIKEKIETAVEKAKDSWGRFTEFVKLMRGSQDSVERASVVLNPRNPKTSSNLSESQVDYVAVSKMIVQYYPEFEALERYADELLLASMSKQGWAVEKMIQHEQAIAEKRLMQLGFKAGEEKKAKENE